MLFNIQRWSLHDGPGIRTTVFFKGCPLRCRWCANPESWSFYGELLFFHDKCTGCGACVQVCPNGANSVTKLGGIEYDRNKCGACGVCVKACPEEARVIAGLELSVDRILEMILKDAVFYRASGGGVTFSGGEPFAQMDILEQLARSCAMEGIPTTVETSGFFLMKDAERVLDWVDGLFMDVKHIDAAVHKSLTGVSNKSIIENILHLDEIGRAMTIRIPLVKGINDTPDNIEGIISLCGQLRNLIGIELLPYHGLGAGKYAALGLPYDHRPAAPQPDDIEKIKNAIRAQRIQVI